MEDGDEETEHMSLGKECTLAPLLKSQLPHFLDAQEERATEQSVILTSSGSLGSQLVSHWVWSRGTPHTPVLG